MWGALASIGASALSSLASDKAMNIYSNLGNIGAGLLSGSKTDLTGGWLGYSSGQSMTKYGSEMALRNQLQAAEQMPSAMRAGYERAGFNPLLALGNMSFGSPAGSFSGSGSAGSHFDGASALNAYMTAKEMRKQAEADTKIKESTAENIEADTKKKEIDTWMPLLTTGLSGVFGLGGTALGSYYGWKRAEELFKLRYGKRFAPKGFNGWEFVPEGAKTSAKSVSRAFPFLPLTLPIAASTAYPAAMHFLGNKMLDAGIEPKVNKKVLNARTRGLGSSTSSSRKSNRRHN